MVWIVSLAEALLTLSLKASVGVAANGTTLAPSIWKLRSGIRLSTNHVRLQSQVREKSPYLCPNLRSSRKSSPVGTDQSNELVAFINRRNVILGLRDSMGMAYPIDQQCFYIGQEAAQRSIALCNLIPSLER